MTLSITTQKTILHCALVAPLLWMAFKLLNGAYGANPVDSILNFSGEWGLRILILTLLMTPLQLWLKSPRPIQFRRMIGLWGCAYASVHFSTFIIFELGLSLSELLEEISEHNYILVGFFAFIILLTLAATSTRNSQRKLGKKWKRIHQGVYIALLLALVHFWMQVKSDYTEPVVYSLVAIIVMLPRWRWLRTKVFPQQKTQSS